MQQDLNPNIWEKKDIRSARQTGVNASRDLVAAFTNAGFYKNKEEALDDFHLFKNMVFDYIYEDMKQTIKTDFHTSSINEDEQQQGLATTNQTRAVWAIIYGDTGNEKLADELPEGISKNTLRLLTFKQASDFIEKYGIKKKE